MRSPKAVLSLVVCWLSCFSSFFHADAKNLQNPHLSAATANKEFNSNIHENLTPRELHSIFGTDDPSKLPSFEIVHPDFVDHNARRNARVRRAIHDEIPMFLHFKAFDIDFHINVTKNKDIVPENQFIEHHTNNGIQRLKGRPATLSTGKIVSEPESNVALDHSSGLTGLIIRKDEIYVISPVQKLGRTESPYSHGAHVIFKRSALPESHPSNDWSCGTKRTTKRSPGGSLIRKRRSTTARPEKTMELMIVADKHMLNLYGKEFLQSYLLAQANMVAGIFKDPTLEYPITVVLTRLVMLDTDEFANATNIFDLLAKFRDWTHYNNPVDDSDPLHVDNMVLVTHAGCLDGCLVPGVAGVGICGRFSSQSITKDAGVMMSITMAHEIAHNIGVDHDGTATSSDCSDGIHIMAEGAVTPQHASEWSKCSSNYIRDRLVSSDSSCYDDKPSSNPFPMNVSFQLYGTVYDDKKQCQLRFNNNYTECRLLSQGKCDKLYCTQPNGNLCSLTLYPPAHGTWCGAHKWCIHGSCVTDGTTPIPPVDGGWSQYSEYTTCNRLCGGGVQWRERKCNNPAPQHGGKNCVGPSKSYWKTCNMQACPTGTTLFRQEQCLALGSNQYYLMDYNQPCQLICATASTSAWYIGNVADGTFANNYGPDICIEGVSRKVGCDLNLESGEIVDRCGVCGGDGSTCVPVSKKESRSFPTYGEHEFAIVPQGSRNVFVEEDNPTYEFLGVKEGTSSNLAYYIPQWSTTVTVAGSTLKYTMDDFYWKDKIEVNGPLTNQIRLFYVNYYGNPSQGISFSYFEPTEGNTSALEYAISTNSQCSKTCAGGTKTKTLICRRADDKTQVSLNLCSSLPKPNTTEACNAQPCPAQWYISPWSACSRSCGTGLRTRTLNCSQLHSDGKYYPVADPSVCTDTKPVVVLNETCNAFMCHAEWVLGEWSKCNTTCGPGMKTKTATCKRTQADGTITTSKDIECYGLVKPYAEEECNRDVPCPEWVQLYGACTKTCGGGFQDSYLECRLPGSDLKVNDSSCTEAKPSSLPPQSCNTMACESYEWKAVDGTCSVSCGNGTVPITVTCQRVSDNATVADEMCLNSTKPATFKECYAGQCPEVYVWKTVKGDCSVTCGKGTAQDTVACFRESDSSKVDDISCDPSVKPNVEPAVECTMPACPETYSWNVTYGPCSVSCSTGTKSPIVKCVKDSDTSAIVDDSLCTSTKPQPESLSCNMGECPPTHFWKELWGDCNVTCGTGEQTSYIRCYMTNTSIEMDNSYCSGLTKPEPTTKQCTKADCLYYWATAHGDCLVSCGTGYKMQTITCKDANDTTVENSKCENEKSAIPAQEACPTLPQCVGAGSAGSKYYGVGCFKDNNVVRNIPYFIKNNRPTIDWTDMSKTVSKCAEEVTNKNKAGSAYKFFSVQFYGECWAGDASAANTYYSSGSSTNCYMGTGGSGVNYVYHFETPIQITNMPAIKSLGCYNDDLTSPRPLPKLIDSFRDEIDWSKPWADMAKIILKKCALAASRAGYKVFGIQHEAECWSGPNAESTYNEDGSSTGCKSGTGINNENYVYIFA